jgi:hypothetical protein
MEEHMKAKTLDDSADLKRMDGPAELLKNFGSKISAETQEALRKIDANIRNAEQQSGRVFIS